MDPDRGGEYLFIIVLFLLFSGGVVVVVEEDDAGSHKILNQIESPVSIQA